MRTLPASLIAAALLPASVAAQLVVRDDENLARDRTEAWAMNYVVSSTLLTSFGDSQALSPGQWRIALDLGHVPRLGESQQRVGLGAVKQEDLNRSPVFGRIRVAAGLPGGFVAEVGYTPPVTIRDTKPRDLFAIAIGRAVFEDGPWRLSARAFGQHGSASGDITCPARLANAASPSNPFGCRAPSSDRIELNYFGADLSAAWRKDSWTAYATAGAIRADLAVQVDALTFEVRDRSRLTSRATLPFFTIGASFGLAPRWTLAGEVLYVPLRVRRDPEGAGSNDPFTGARLQIAYRFG